MGASEDKKQIIEDPPLSIPVVQPARRKKKDVCKIFCKYTAFVLAFWLFACILAGIFIDEYGTTIIYVKYNDLSERLGSLKSYYDYEPVKQKPTESMPKEEAAKPSNTTSVVKADATKRAQAINDQKARPTVMEPMTVQVFDHSFFLPWYFRGGERRPSQSRRSRKTGKRFARIFPSEDSYIDRITNQLMFVPPNYDKVVEGGARKTILLYDGLEAWNLAADGNAYFQDNECPVSTCMISTDRSVASKANMVLYKDRYEPMDVERSTDQVYGLYWRDSPPYVDMTDANGVFNWTATYRMDSTLVDPFKKWEIYDQRTRPEKTDINYAAGKTKQVAWYTDVCETYNNRMAYVLELAKFIQVDIYGPCGSLKCPNDDPKECSKLISRDYKFNLAFEKANCRDYITDDFYTNLIDRQTVPIVMGAHPDDYANRAPPQSYIHVDHFKTPSDLANYLTIIDNNDDLYNRYFEWRGSGEFIDTKFFCRVCAMMHDDYYFASGMRSNFRDLESWWDGPGICTRGDWKEDSSHHSVADDACGILDFLFGHGVK